MPERCKYTWKTEDCLLTGGEDCLRIRENDLIDMWSCSLRIVLFIKVCCTNQYQKAFSAWGRREVGLTHTSPRLCLAWCCVGDAVLSESSFLLAVFYLQQAHAMTANLGNIWIQLYGSFSWVEEVLDKTKNSSSPSAAAIVLTCLCGRLLLNNTYTHRALMLYTHTCAEMQMKGDVNSRVSWNPYWNGLAFLKLLLPSTIPLWN